MTTGALIEAIKDACVEDLAAEYHRLNRPDERQHLPSIEWFLGGVAAAFLVPYVKRLAEKAADATWKQLATRLAKNRDYSTLESQIPGDASTTIENCSDEEHLQATNEAESVLLLFLSEHDIPEDVQSRVVVRIRETLVHVRRSRSR
jgi:hypothetical protein